MQARNEFGFLRKESFTRENVHILAVEESIMFWSTKERRCETIYMHNVTFNFIHVYILWFKNEKLAFLCVCKLHLKSYIALY